MKRDSSGHIECMKSLKNYVFLMSFNRNPTQLVSVY